MDSDMRGGVPYLFDSGKFDQAIEHPRASPCGVAHVGSGVPPCNTAVGAGGPGGGDLMIQRLTLSKPYNRGPRNIAKPLAQKWSWLAFPMTMVLPDHPHPPAQSLFCRTGDACEHRPAIAMKVRETFAANFAADFAAAMTEHRHETDEKRATAA